MKSPSGVFGQRLCDLGCLSFGQPAATPLHKKYGDVFLYTDVPEADREEVAGQVADKILAQLKDEIRSPEKVA